MRHCFLEHDLNTYCFSRDVACGEFIALNNVGTYAIWVRIHMRSSEVRNWFVKYRYMYKGFPYFLIVFVPNVIDIHGVVQPTYIIIYKPFK